MPERFICDNCDLVAKAKWPASWVKVWEVVDEEMKMFCTPDCLIDYFTARTLLGGIHD
jgi:hypothetical protein